jgi:hypothetical protein
MENWGLVTYREVDLLIDPTKASSNQKQRVCTVVTHGKAMFICYDFEHICLLFLYGCFFHYLLVACFSSTLTNP